ncbi:hypothetical protein HC928_01320 [bacterium]|nr:hypothetical protein [bacterium]
MLGIKTIRKVWHTAPVAEPETEFTMTTDDIPRVGDVLALRTELDPDQQQLYMVLADGYHAAYADGVVGRWSEEWIYVAPLDNRAQARQWYATEYLNLYDVDLIYAVPREGSAS